MACALTAALLPQWLFAGGSGSRASFTRGGWAGARYAAMGMAAEVITDDVYAMYWNPAGLTELKGKKQLSITEIKEKARTGKVDEISEGDLLKFSDEQVRQSFFQVGFSGASLDIERNAGFAGFAFNLFRGVLGIGVYSIYSPDIESRNESGDYLKKLNYTASEAFISYSWTAGISSLGFSLKTLYEQIGETMYAGPGADIGIQVYVLPFLKIGFMAQDLGTFLYPVDSAEDVEKRYDFASPVLRLGAAFYSDSGIVLAISAVKKLEQEDYDYGFGIQYDVMKNFALYLGLNNSLFSAGAGIDIGGMNISYAFSVDNIDYGYNNMVSVTLLL